MTRQCARKFGLFICAQWPSATSSMIDSNKSWSSASDRPSTHRSRLRHAGVPAIISTRLCLAAREESVVQPIAHFPSTGLHYCREIGTILAPLRSSDSPAMSSMKLSASRHGRAESRSNERGSLRLQHKVYSSILLF